MKLIDIHAHLQFPQFDGDLEAVIERAREAEIGVINVGTDLETSRAAVALAEAYPNLMRATIGIHPTDPPKVDELTSVFIELEKLAKHSRVVGIGECGLDYFHVKDGADRKKQIEIFERQIELAKIVSKPLMIHCRPSPNTQDAYKDILQILNQKLEAKSHKLSGNVHFFAGHWDEAKLFLDLGFSLSFTGVVTFTNNYDEVIKKAPLDRIMIETDCPFVAPAPYRGKRNEPSYLPMIVERLAALRGFLVGEIATTTTSNAERLFAFSPSFC